MCGIQKYFMYPHKRASIQILFIIFISFHPNKQYVTSLYIYASKIIGTLNHWGNGACSVIFLNHQNTVNLLVKFEKAAYFVDIFFIILRVYSCCGCCILENRPHTQLRCFTHSTN